MNNPLLVMCLKSLMDGSTDEVAGRAFKGCLKLLAAENTPIDEEGAALDLMLKIFPLVRQLLCGGGANG